jgi:hypothetical protein
MCRNFLIDFCSRAKRGVNRIHVSWPHQGHIGDGSLIQVAVGVDSGGFECSLVAVEERRRQRGVDEAGLDQVEADRRELERERRGERPQQ